MLPRDPRAFLSDILYACDGVLSRTQGKALDDYRADETLRLACERLLGIVGEAVVQLRRHDASLALQLGEVDRIAGFRNVIIHGYFKLVDDIVWEIVRSDLPRLRQNAAAMLEQMGST